MALRISTKRLTASLKPSASANCILKRYASQLPNPDPVEDSETGAIVREQTPYMVKTYAKPPPIFVRGKGVNLWDKEDRKYLDFTAGIAVNALGHCDEEMSEIIADQAKTLVHTSNLYHNLWTGTLSELLVKKTVESGGMHDASAAFICNSGTEANEAAIKFARKIGNSEPNVRDLGHGERASSKSEIVSFHGSFHGRTLGALSATPNPKYQDPFRPLLPGFKYAKFNDIEQETYLKKLITKNTCGVIVEPIQGEGGVNEASIEFLIALARICKEKKAVLIYDEIQCGLSRTGTFWAHSHLPKEAHPDIITTAKALGNGFPIGATIVNQRVADAIKVGDHGTTFGGNPLGSRIANNIVSRLADPKLQEGVIHKGEIFRKHFENLQKKYPELVQEVRGRGLILGLQLSQDPTPIVTAARERGLLIITAGKNTLRFVPALNITEAEIEEGIKILDEAMSVGVTPGEEPAGEQVKGEVDSPN